LESTDIDYSVFHRNELYGTGTEVYCVGNETLSKLYTKEV